MYANGTTHYNLPQTVGTDKRDWADTNEAFAQVDADLHTAVETSSSAAGNVAALAITVAHLGEAQITFQHDLDDLELTVGQQGNAITANANRIEEVEDDALDMICAVDEGTAQIATVAVEEGKYFRYNNVLYQATANIAIGDTIVPNTNCKATNVATELEGIVVPSTPTANEVSYNNTSSGMSATNVQDAIDELDTALATVKTYGNCDILGTQTGAGTSNITVDLSQYRYIGVACCTGAGPNGFYNLVTIPTGLFTSVSGVLHSTVSSTNGDMDTFVSYTDTTHITLTVYQPLASFNGVVIGIK